MNIKNLRHKLVSKNSMLGQVSTVAGGTIVAQGLNLLCTPVLSRIYSPEDFGIVSVFVSIMSILVPLSSMRYYLSIALPKTKRYSDACVLFSFIIEIITTVVFFLLIFLFGNNLLKICGIAKIIPYKFLLPIGIFFYATYMLLTQWAIRNAIFGVIARTKITQSVSGNAVKMGMALLGIKPLGLILGTIISYGGGITSILREMFEKGFPQSYKRDIKRVAIKYRNFPKYDVLSSTLNTAGTQLIPVLVFVYFGAKVTGFFSMANQLLVIPSVFVGEAIGQVFLQRASRAKYDGGLDVLTLKTYRNLMHIGMFPLVILALFAPVIFKLVLGVQWNDAGVYSQLLVFFTLFSFCFSPISHVYSICNRQDLSMLLEIFYCTVRIGAFVLGAQTGNSKIAVGCLGIVAGLAVIVRAYFALKIAGVNAYDFYRAVLKEIYSAVLLSLPVILIWLFTSSLWISVIVAAIMFAIYAKGILCLVQEMR